MLGVHNVLKFIVSKKRSEMKKKPSPFTCPKCGSVLTNYSQSIITILDNYFEEIIKKCENCGETFIERNTQRHQLRNKCSHLID